MYSSGSCDGRARRVILLTLLWLSPAPADPEQVGSCGAAWQTRGLCLTLRGGASGSRSLSPNLRDSLARGAGKRQHANGEPHIQLVGGAESQRRGAGNGTKQRRSDPPVHESGQGGAEVSAARVAGDRAYRSGKFDVAVRECPPVPLLTHAQRPFVARARYASGASRPGTDSRAGAPQILGCPGACRRAREQRARGGVPAGARRGEADAAGFRGRGGRQPARR